MRPISAIRAARSLGSAVALVSVVSLAGVAVCYDDDLQPAPPRTGGSTVVVSKPGVTSPQPTVVQQAPAPQSAPPIINNVVQPATPAPAPAPTYVAPAPTPAPGTTVNVQPRTVNVP
jgi:hypothetical protein